MKKLTGSEENYVESIHALSARGPVRVGDLAELLGVKLPSVSRAVAGLAEQGLVRHEAYGQVELTADGTKVALEIARRNACLTRLLVDLLAMPAKEAASEVHRLEHVVDGNVLWRLETLVEFALDSDAWVRRLHYRILKRSREAKADPGAFLVGKTPIHAGAGERETLDKSGSEAIFSLN
jgi:DtxR family Mn-dependent transcriptional regulator